MLRSIGRPILANLPTYPRPILSDFGKPTYQPKNRTSYVDGPLYNGGWRYEIFEISLNWLNSSHDFVTEVEKKFPVPD